MRLLVSSLGHSMTSLDIWPVKGWGEDTDFHMQCCFIPHQQGQKTVHLLFLLTHPGRIRKSTAWDSRKPHSNCNPDTGAPLFLRPLFLARAGVWVYCREAINPTGWVWDAQETPSYGPNVATRYRLSGLLVTVWQTVLAAPGRWSAHKRVNF